MPKRKLSFALLVFLFAFATAVVPAGAITNGQPDGTAHPNVGVIVVDFGAGPQRECSGELIAPTPDPTLAAQRHHGGHPGRGERVGGVLELTVRPEYEGCHGGGSGACLGGLDQRRQAPVFRPGV